MAHASEQNEHRAGTPYRIADFEFGTQGDKTPKDAKSFN